MNALQDKKVLVLGADSIGRGIAIRLAREGASIAVLDPMLSAATEVAEVISAKGGSALAYAAAFDGQMGATLKMAIAALSGVDVLINNVLPIPTIAPLEDQPRAAFDEAFARVQAAICAMQCAVPAMQLAGAGRIINVGHRYGEGINEGLAAYNAAAWSLVGLTRTAALDWGRYQITTNLLLPLADSPEVRHCHALRPRVIDLMIGQLPLGRLGDPVEDVGGAALFLASDACCFVNGETLHGDGGQHLAGPVLNPARFV
ncbi:SDR family NAD(P)-dependent oxidoreductase [Pseudomonas sp. SIMBA_068]|uniref:SDR family NAD(P)-dependent oxidoreductase n=1 Tax=Pseudomonas sp. SIMBA_068 TaxID=3085808 RepID=UPI00397D6223